MSRTLAILKSTEILMQSEMRTILREGDMEAARAYKEALTHLTKYTERIMDELGKPKRWYMYCRTCNVNYPECVTTSPRCSNCGDRIQRWDLSNLGERPRRRM